MNLKHLKSIIFFVMLGWLVISCYKEPKFSSSPVIDFYSIEKNIRLDQFTGAKKDSIVIEVTFQDKEGDLGINIDQVGTVYDKTDFNYIVKSFRKKNGKFVEFTPLDSFSGFYPVLRTDGKEGPIEGRLGHSIQIETGFWPVKKDTVKFEISIKDRANNLSNSVETKPIIINEF